MRAAAISLFLLGLHLSPACCIQQSFRVRPTNSEVVEGQSIYMRCEVNNQEGQVQWAKDGFVLGYERDVPGYERYSMSGNAMRGEHHLLILNATVDDDGGYQCQVGPAKSSKAIWANAKLTVLLPPKSIEISNFVNNSAVVVKQHEMIQLSCTVGQSKPPAEIKWFRNNAEIHQPDMIVYKTTEGDNGRLSAVSIITIKPSPEDNGVTYSCQASHHKLEPPLVTMVRLSVLFPPGPPEILGYSEGEVLRAGNAVELRCVSRGGNPLATVVWYKGSDNKPCDSSFTTTSRDSINTLKFIANATDNNAVYRCVASNQISKPETAHIKLSVQYGPTAVTIEHDAATSAAKVGDRVMMKCRSAPSNPKADISWTVDGRPVNGSKAQSRLQDGGWISTSELSVEITKEDRKMKVFTCYAVNQALGETVVQTAAVDIIYPPTQTKIYGYKDEEPMKAGEQYTLFCVTKGGNPPPQHVWYRGNSRLESSAKTDNATVKSEVTFTATERDNGRSIRCEASQKNSAPQKSSITPKVVFGPYNVTLTALGACAAGRNATLECRTGSSQPPSEITWWKNNKLVEVGQHESTVSGNFGGTIVVSKLVLNPVLAEDHGAIIRCQATNPRLQKSEHHTMDLLVEHAPLLTLRVDSLSFFEGDAAFVQNVIVSAYLPVSRYEWLHDGKRLPLAKEGEKHRAAPRHRVSYKGDALNFTKIHRNDSGIYVLKAQNNVGWGETNFTIDVHYPASITHLDEVVYADEGSNPTFQCQVDAHPVQNDTVYWEREGFDMARSRTTFKGRADEKTATSFFTVFNVSRADIGVFNCVANNRLTTTSTTSASKGAMLVVNFKAEIDRHPALSKAAANESGVARLRCRAQGAREVSFSWRRNNVELRRTKYDLLQRRVEGSYVQWESELVISDVRPSDYGNYTCVAQTDLGSDHAQVLLTTIGPPEVPVAVSLSNATISSIVVSWEPGFSGGLAQSFKLRYRAHGRAGEGFTYRELITPDVHNMTVAGLDMYTEYEFSVQAYNSYGESDFTEAVTGRTLDELSESSGQPLPSAISKVDIPKMIITSVSVVGTLLLLLNILLVVCFVRKKKSKRQKDEGTYHSYSEESEHSATKPAAIEMYAPPPSYTNATVATAETVSSASDKSDTVHFSSDESTLKPSSFILEGNMEANAHYQQPHSAVATFYHDDSSLVTAKPQLAPAVDRHATLPARHHHHRVHYAPEVGRRLSEAECPYFRGNPGPPTPPGRTAASAVGVALRGDMYNVGYITYPHAELTSFNSNRLAATQISEHDGHLV